MRAYRPIRVMQVVPTLLSGGTEHQFMALTEALDHRHFDLTCACLRRQGDLANDLEKAGIALDEYPITSFRRPSSIAQQIRFAAALRRQRIDVVHAYSFYGNVFALPPARFARVPALVASIRDCGPYLTTAQKRVQRAVGRLADCILVNADAVKNWAIDEGYDGRKITVIRNGVDLRRFQHRGHAAAVRSELNLPTDTPLVGLISRLVPLKGVEHFLIAAAQLSSAFPDAHFLVVGDSWPEGNAYADSLKQLAARLGITAKTTFTGRRTDVPALLGAMTVAVSASLSEGLPNTVLEAMAASVPVVATRVGGTPEVLTDQVTGLLIPPGDSAALASAIGRLLAAPDFAVSLAAAARQLVETEFSLERMARATERLYAQLLSTKRNTIPSTAAVHTSRV
jgi:L-malate glycosyltransferase